MEVEFGSSLGYTISARQFPNTNLAVSEMIETLGSPERFKKIVESLARLEIMKKNMKRIFLILIILQFSLCGSTIEFIPDSDFSATNIHFAKKTPDDIEILHTKPTRPFKSIGKVTIRKFSEASLDERRKKEIKLELFQRKIDGVWIPDRSEKVEGVPFLVKAENQMGAMVTFGETPTDMEIQEGIAFRYRENGKIGSNLRQ